MSEPTARPHDNEDLEASSHNSPQDARTSALADRSYTEDVQNRRTTDISATGTASVDNKSVPFASAHTQHGTTASSIRSSDTVKTDGPPGHHSPSPYRPGPTSIQVPQTWEDALPPREDSRGITRSSKAARHPRSNASDPLPRTNRSARIGTTPTVVGDSGVANTRVPQFSSLEGLISADQLNHLRVLGIQYGLQAAKLKTVSENLGALNSQTVDIRDQASGAISRIQRSITDNNRFLVEGDHYLSEMAAVFDDPVITSTVSAPAVSRHAPRDSSPTEETSDDDTQFNRDYRGPEHLPALTPQHNHEPISPIAPTELWAQQGSAAELRDRQYQATVRRMDNTQQSWVEPYGITSPPTDISAPRNREPTARDVRFDRTDTLEREQPPHRPAEPRTPIRTSALHISLARVRVCVPTSHFPTFPRVPSPGIRQVYLQEGP